MLASLPQFQFKFLFRFRFRIPDSGFLLFHTPIEFRLTALPILGYPSVHFSAWPRFTYGLHFPAFPCPPPPPRPRLMLLLSIPFRLRFISIHKSYLAAPKSRDITHKPSLLGCLFTGLPVRPSHKMGFRSSAAKNGFPGEGRHEGLVPRNDVLTNGFM